MAGEAAYIDDMPELAGTLHCALGLSPVAHGKLLALDLEAVRAMPGVVAVLTAADIPGVIVFCRVDASMIERSMICIVTCSF